MKPLEYIQSESDRQGATFNEVLGMFHAWEYALRFSQKVPTNATIIHTAKLLNGCDGYRKVPAVFDQGRPAPAAELIPQTMFRWNAWASDVQDFKTEFDIDKNEWVLDQVIKEFLEIHPFSDGNGRIASLLYNHFRGSMTDPVPLPYYFGDN